VEKIGGDCRGHSGRFQDAFCCLWGRTFVINNNEGTGGRYIKSYILLYV